MTRWKISLGGPPFTQVIDAEFLAIEHGALVFRDAPAGVILLSHAAGRWASVETIKPYSTDADVFSKVTRDIVQG
jgi:hypothetical protein